MYKIHDVTLLQQTTEINYKVWPLHPCSDYSLKNCHILCFNIQISKLSSFPFVASKTTVNFYMIFSLLLKRSSLVFAVLFLGAITSVNRTVFFKRPISLLAIQLK